MEKEISSGAMLGIVLIALAAIIGIGFGVFAIAKGTANTGVTNVQEKLESVSQSDYTDYDQTIVTGTMVKSAYDNFAGKSAAILIATSALKDNTTDGVISTTAAGVKAAYGTVSSTLLKVPVVLVQGSDKADSLGWTKSNGKPVTSPVMINYNALLASSEGGSSIEKAVSSDSAAVTPYIYFDNNCYRTDYGYFTSGGKIQYNYISGNLSKSGMVEYLPSSARFQAYLIKDASGTTMGVAFEQISSK
jgi:hypothetical protein